MRPKRYLNMTPAQLQNLFRPLDGQNKEDVKAYGVGYRILLAACGPHGPTAQGAPAITHGAIYFSRHAALERFRYLDLIDRQDFLRLAEWFIRYVSNSSDEANLLVERVRTADGCGD